jgi:murein DD-endopeptidase MepM/ murein hydrolase activator NlpD
MIAQKAPGSGKVHTDTPEPITVKKGDTLVAISRRTKVYVADLADLNGLKAPYRLKLGSKIKLPSKRYYQVESGDTLYSIARRFGLEAKALAEFNKFDADKGVHPGEKINLPDDAKDKGVPKPIMVAAPRPRAEPAYEASTPSSPQPYTPPYTPPPYSPPPPAPSPTTARTVQAPAAMPAPSPTAPTVAKPSAATPPATPSTPADTTPSGALGDSEVAAAGRGVFQWPVRGELINTFGQKGAVRSDGIDIGATQGDSVRSAADGEVVYAGNAVQGFGNLVLIKHQGGWVTAYAHLASIEVKMRQPVTQGQEIGLVGQSGGVDRPQLHFEIRYAPTPKDKARPVDPMLVLPVK